MCTYKVKINCIEGSLVNEAQKLKNSRVKGSEESNFAGRRAFFFCLWVLKLCNVLEKGQ